MIEIYEQERAEPSYREIMELREAMKDNTLPEKLNLLLLKYPLWNPEIVKPIHRFLSL